MIDALISLIIKLIVAGLIVWAVQAILAVLPWIVEPFKTIIWICVVVVAVLICLGPIGQLLHMAAGFAH